MTNPTAQTMLFSYIALSAAVLVLAALFASLVRQIDAFRTGRPVPTTSAHMFSLAVPTAILIALALAPVS